VDSARARRTAAHADLEQEKRALLHDWSFFVHPRAVDFFGKEEELNKVLQQILENLDVGSDPICGPADQCVLWRGESESNRASESSHACMKVKKPEGESQVWVNRVLAFVFASDATFLELMKLPKEPFKMSCGNQLCINTAHMEPPLITNECTRVTAVTLHQLNEDSQRGPVLSCTTVGGTELSQLEVDPEETTLAHVRAAVAQRLSISSAALQLLTSNGDVLAKSSDTTLVCSLPL
jgi:hypothetical protein